MKKYDQNKVPLLEALTGYARRTRGRYHVPGHGGGRGAPADLLELVGQGVFSLDVTELPGLDDLNNPTGVIASAQELAADAFGAGRSFFLTGGTTQGLQALVLASGKPGDRLILPRNCHRSLLGGLVLAGMEPVFVKPSVVPGFNFTAGVPVGEYQRALKNHPDACAMVCIHPTYYGTVGNTGAISLLAGAAGMPLLADEAHGCHFYFHPGFPDGALVAGADAAAQSIHKTGGSLTQSSMLHLACRSLIDPDRVFAAIKLLQTSSPSYILMASLDAARRQLALKGPAVTEGLLRASWAIWEALAGVPGIEILGCPHLDGDAVFALDPSRVVIKVSGTGLTGWQAASWLADSCGIYAEMADRDNIILVPWLGISAEECRGLALAVKDMARREGGPALPPVPSAGGLPVPAATVGVREAWFSPARPVRLEKAAGLVCGEWVAVYPPGIPVLLPGEEVSPAALNYLIEARESGARFQGPADPGLKDIRVIDI